MLNRIGMRNLLANGDFHLYRLVRIEWREQSYDWGMLLGFPVGGFDKGREHFVSFYLAVGAARAGLLKRFVRVGGRQLELRVGVGERNVFLH